MAAVTPAFLTYGQVSRRIGVCKKTLCRMVEERRFIQPVRLRDKPMFRSDEVDKWIREKVS